MLIPIAICTSIVFKQNMLGYDVVDTVKIRDIDKGTISHLNIEIIVTRTTCVAHTTLFLEIYVLSGTQRVLEITNSRRFCSFLYRPH